MFRPRPPANANGARRSTQTTRPLTENSTLVMPPVAFARHGTTPRSVPGGSCGRHAQLLEARVPAHELEVAAPVPVRPGIGVVRRAAAAAAGCRHFGVADDVLPVDRHQRAPRNPRGEPGRGVVLRVGEALRAVRVALVLDSDGVGVDLPVAGVPGDVREVDELHDPAAARDDVVRRRMCARALQPPDRAPERALGDVHDDPVDRFRVAMRLREVALALEPGERRARTGRPVRGRGEEARSRDRRGEEFHPAKTHAKPAQRTSRRMRLA